ncbi:protease [Pyxidicoccus fallax]|uniref:Protease n=1 Tax=Pyxidicoccus fallax TaxID=394095 RepID=A0A848L8J2_9BACT|nr:zinc-dependent metalloprotease [Pyxidicoccus fallax]NMO14877.1 protease [Pyxidicoccus fallax]NPC77822.1 protease [Pyxidicoccus fallax]
MLKKAAVLVVSCGVLLAGCDTDPHLENEETISNLVEAGFPADDIMVVDGAVYVGRDTHVSLDASRELLQRGEKSAEHFCTTNLVDVSVVKKICINPTSAFNSYARLSQGLDAAIANYNQLGLCFTMARGPTTGCDANITAQTMSGTGGSAGFPSNGRPYGTINIGTGLNSYGVDVIEHVITHELGHTIGLRHTDYYNRAISCGGSATNEGTAGVGAIHIPGTPTTATVGSSIMNSCFRSTETGEFTSYDIIALNYLYGNC